MIKLRNNKLKLKSHNTFIAEQATPVSLTVTFPWQPATPMVTAGVRNTLVTVVTLPSVMAPRGKINREHFTLRFLTVA